MSASRRTARLLAAGGALLALAACEPPPVETVQLNFRGLGAAEVIRPAAYAADVRDQTPPDPLPPAVPAGILAASAFQNVPVLGHVDVAEFTRQMQAITLWVSPQQGCNYCHVGTDLAVDSPYTKLVARRMIQMTQHINQEWSQHVGSAGVTCWTCHRGEVVPAQVWTFPGADRTRGILPSSRQGQNLANPEVGLTSLPGQPFPTYLLGDADIRLQATTPGGTGSPGGVKAAEQTYGLMMHMSQALGVNCTYCHNSPRFADWEQSTPARATAWHGIRMVRDLNQAYLAPLASILPPERKGPAGDSYKIDCATCHRGAFRPAYGRSITAAFPALLTAPPAAPPAPPAPDSAGG